MAIASASSKWPEVGRARRARRTASCLIPSLACRALQPHPPASEARASGPPTPFTRFRSSRIPIWMPAFGWALGERALPSASYRPTVGRGPPGLAFSDRTLFLKGFSSGRTQRSRTPPQKRRRLHRSRPTGRGGAGSPSPPWLRNMRDSRFTHGGSPCPATTTSCAAEPVPFSLREDSCSFVVCGASRLCIPLCKFFGSTFRSERRSNQK
jgi:hypothetical protein